MNPEVVTSCLVCDSPRLSLLDPPNAIHRCATCGLLFSSPRPSAAEIIAYYSRSSQYDTWIDDRAVRDRLWQRRLAKVRRHSRPGSLLDVGAGIGQFLHHARPYFDYVTGTEVSSAAVALARDLYGIDLLWGQVETLAIPRSFDNITIFHVLEHVLAPQSLISRSVELLEPNGMLFIAVPDEVDAVRQRAKRTLARLGVKRFSKSGLAAINLATNQPEIHLSHFTLTSLRLLLERNGLVVVEQGLDPYSISSGTKRLRDRLLMASSEVVLRTTRRNMYDAIWMVAQKRAARTRGAAMSSVAG